MYVPYSFETGQRGSQDRGKITYQKIEANVPLDDQRFTQPGPGAPSSH